MARYRVEVDQRHRPVVSATVQARCPEAAYATVRSRLIAEGFLLDGHTTITVRRRRRSFTYAGWPPGNGDQGGDSGVREPRQPDPAPPSGQIALTEPT